MMGTLGSGLSPVSSAGLFGSGLGATGTLGNGTGGLGLNAADPNGNLAFTLPNPNNGVVPNYTSTPTVNPNANVGRPPAQPNTSTPAGYLAPYNYTGIDQLFNQNPFSQFPQFVNVPAIQQVATSTGGIGYFNQNYGFLPSTPPNGIRTVQDLITLPNMSGNLNALLSAAGVTALPLGGSGSYPGGSLIPPAFFIPYGLSPGQTTTGGLANIEGANAALAGNPTAGQAGSGNGLFGTPSAGNPALGVGTPPPVQGGGGGLYPVGTAMGPLASNGAGWVTPRLAVGQPTGYYGNPVANQPLYYTATTAPLSFPSSFPNSLSTQPYMANGLSGGYGATPSLGQLAQVYNINQNGLYSGQNPLYGLGSYS
jgi:hypothetical protein